MCSLTYTYHLVHAFGVCVFVPATRRFHRSWFLLTVRVVRDGSLELLAGRLILHFLRQSAWDLTQKHHMHSRATSMVKFCHSPTVRGQAACCSICGIRPEGFFSMGLDALVHGAVADCPRTRISDFCDCGTQPTKLFVGGISRRTTTKHLRKHFLKYGQILDCVAMRLPNGRPRGFGYVTVESTAVAMQVLLETHCIDEHVVDVKIAVPDSSGNTSSTPTSVKSSPSREDEHVLVASFCLLLPQVSVALVVFWEGKPHFSTRSCSLAT